MAEAQRTPPPWVPPESRDAGRERLRALITMIESIDAQLGDRSSTRREDYWDWRQRVKWAKYKRLEELRNLKAWLSNPTD